MSFIKEFKEFALKGNAIDMAIGILIGANFNKIVSSLVADIISPILGALLGGINFGDLKITLKSPVISDQETVIQEAVTMNIGNFLQVLFDFMIVAFALFMAIKAINILRERGTHLLVSKKPSEKHN
jgi:large conductance mechanosensitive channel